MDIINITINANDGLPEAINLIENDITMYDYSTLIKDPSRILEFCNDPVNNGPHAQYTQYIKAVITYIFYENYKKAISICRKVKIRSTIALIGIIYNDELYSEYNQSKAIRYLTDASTDLALIELAKIYKFEDVNLAISYLKSVDSRQSRYELGILYLQYDDINEAIKWFEILPRTNRSSYELGNIYQNMNQISEALTYYEESGLTVSYKEIAQIYFEGKGDIQRNKQKAAFYFTKAKDKESLEKLANIYLDTESKLYDPQRGIRYLRLLQDNRLLYEIFLPNSNENRRGIEPNIDNAMFFLERHLSQVKNIDTRENQTLLLELIHYHIDSVYKSLNIEESQEHINKINELYDNLTDENKKKINVNIDVNSIDYNNIVDTVDTVIYSEPELEEVIDSDTDTDISDNWELLEIEAEEELILDLPDIKAIAKPMTITKFVDMVSNKIRLANSGDKDAIYTIENDIDFFDYVSADYLKTQKLLTKLREVVNKVGKGPYTTYLEAMILYIDRKFNNADAKLRKVKTKSAQFLKTLVYSYTNVYTKEQAEKAFINIGTKLAYDQLAAMYFKDKDEEKLVEAADSADTVKSYTRAGDYFMNMKPPNYEKAIYFYNKGNDPQTYKDMANAYYKLGKYDYAMYYYDALNDNCGKGKVYMNTESRLFDIEKAIRSLDSCTDYITYYYLGLIYTGNGEYPPPYDRINYALSFLNISRFIDSFNAEHQDTDVSIDKPYVIEFLNAILKKVYIIFRIYIDEPPGVNIIQGMISFISQTSKILIDTGYQLLGKMLNTFVLIYNLKGHDAFIEAIKKKVDVIGMIDLTATEQDINALIR